MQRKGIPERFTDIRVISTKKMRSVSSMKKEPRITSNTETMEIVLSDANFKRLKKGQGIILDRNSKEYPYMKFVRVTRWKKMRSVS